MTITTNYLDFREVLVNDIFGTGNDIWFIIAGAIVLFYIAAKFKVPDKVMLVLMIIYGLIMSSIYQALLPIIALLFALIIGWAFIKLQKKED